MLKSITTLLLGLFFLSVSYSQSNRIYGSFESNAVYYQKNEEEKEESPTTLIDALQGADMKEGGKKKTKVNRKKNKFNHTKKAKK